MKCGEVYLGEVEVKWSYGLSNRVSIINGRYIDHMRFAAFDYHFFFIFSVLFCIIVYVVVCCVCFCLIL